MKPTESICILHRYLLLSATHNLAAAHVVAANPDWLNPEKTELVPEAGVILPAQTVTFYEGESVFNVLQRNLSARRPFRYRL